MKRRTFLKNTLPLAFSPLFIESMIRQQVSELFGFDAPPPGFSDRKLIILNMFGANDGLNNVLPVDQYDLYSNLRPTIGLQNIGGATPTIEQPGLIALDNSLPTNKQLWLNGAMSPFKTLYDEGKLNVIQSVGYPSPNLSHFKSDSLIFGAKDGTYRGTVERGWMANYLSTIFPSYVDRSTSQYPHPLGIQIGLNYRHNGYVHDVYKNIGVNINNLANSEFYANLGRPPSSSEYQTLLDYLNQVAIASDTYSQRIAEAFNAGTNMNGSVAYPDSDLGNQFKTLARLISGGLDTKILTAFRGALDTHTNQLNRHNRILTDVTESIYAFQKDMEVQGLADKVIILTMSEFGRQIKQNANDGTDHGTLSPWFVIGNPVKGGVTGVNIDLTQVSSNGYHTTDVLQHDYRRILSTIIQDWFGNSDETLNQIGLGNFSGDIGSSDGKLDILKDGIAPANTVPNFSEEFIDEFELIEIETVDNWTYYGRLKWVDDNGTIDDVTDDENVYEYVFAIEHRPNETGANTNTFVPRISISDLLDDGTGRNYYQHINTNKANFTLGKSWNITLLSGTLTGFVNMRFFVNKLRLANLAELATDFYEITEEGEKSNALAVKTTNGLLNSETDLNYTGFTQAIEGIGPTINGAYKNQNYYQFNEVTNFNNRGGAICHIVTDKFSGFDDYENPGTIISIDNGKLYGYNGTEWKKLFNE